MSEFGFMNPHTEEEDKERYALLGLEYKSDPWGNGGIESFNNLKLDTMKTLVEKGYLDLDERQNDSPTVEDFMKLLEEYPDFHAHGYLVVNYRDDRRISIEGIESDSLYFTDEELEDAEKIMENLEMRIEDMGYYTEEFDVYNGNIWLWWD